MLISLFFWGGPFLIFDLPGGLPGCTYEVAPGEGDIHQRGVSGDGENGGSGDE
jgi:hypothetical protein